MKSLQHGWAIGVSIFLLATGLAWAEETYELEIADQDLSTALKSFAEQSGLQVVYFADLADGKRTKGVHGSYSAAAALDALLDDTDLTFTSVDDRTYSIAAPDSGEEAEDPGNAMTTPQPMMMVQASAEEHRTTTPSSESNDARRPLEEIVVTGSRLRRSGLEGAREVQIYSRQQIDQSGQSTVAGFLNTLPQMSISREESVFQSNGGATSVQLRGLPLGTTLVLINGRRVESTATQITTGIFDLNNIPVAAIERIEIVSEGASAIYGSDALAGVVNIILRERIESPELNIRYGRASGTNEASITVAGGLSGENGSVSLFASYLDRSELDATERAVTANRDFRRFGGSDVRSDVCDPGSVYSLTGVNLPGLNAPSAGIPSGIAGTPTIADFQSLQGAPNRCSRESTFSLIPDSERLSLFLRATYNLHPTLELFGEAMYADTRETSYTVAPGLANGAFGTYVVPTSNPYNPFGVDVGVSTAFTDLGRASAAYETRFLRSLVGLRGNIGDRWDYEVAAFTSRNRNMVDRQGRLDSVAVRTALASTDPATALNVFTTGEPAPGPILSSFVSPLEEQYRGSILSGSAFVRGSLLDFAAGSLQSLLGVESSRYELEIDSALLGAFPNSDRTVHAAFIEMRAPLLAPRTRVVDSITATLAARYDDYSDFGSELTPQFGLEWRVSESLLFRGTYGEAFVAPLLYSLNAPRVSVGQTPISDPRRNDEVYLINVLSGGNPNLRPQTGESRSVWVVLSPSTIPGLSASLTWWNLSLDDPIQFLGRTTLIANEDLFSAAIVREPDVGGQIGRIQSIAQGFHNFGTIEVRGIDLKMEHEISTAIGMISPTVAVTWTSEYTASLAAGEPATQRVSKGFDDLNWAPRWKASGSVGWSQAPWNGRLGVRYVGSYQDYGSSTRELGNHFFVDANVKFAFDPSNVGLGALLSSGYVEIGAVNLFDKSPEYANQTFGLFGYDTAQADIRGRFVYAQLGTRW